MIKKECPSHPVSIFIAGAPASAKEVCREYCDGVGYCVTVTPTTYVYRDGEEVGVIVGLINYPRFPGTREEMWAHANKLAERLRRELGQESYSIQSPDRTEWTSFRKSA